MASSSPVVRVTHPEVKVTHEAAIGSVDHKQLETLMARGLDPDEAVHVIVRGMLSRREYPIGFARKRLLTEKLNVQHLVRLYRQFLPLANSRGLTARPGG